MAKSDVHSPDIYRLRLCRFIAQGHLAPGMSLVSWREVVMRHLGAPNWDHWLADWNRMEIPLGQLEAIIKEIRERK